MILRAAGIRLQKRLGLGYNKSRIQYNTMCMDVLPKSVVVAIKDYIRQNVDRGAAAETTTAGGFD